MYRITQKMIKACLSVIWFRAECSTSRHKWMCSVWAISVFHGAKHDRFTSHSLTGANQASDFDDCKKHMKLPRLLNLTDSCSNSHTTDPIKSKLVSALVSESTIWHNSMKNIKVSNNRGSKNLLFDRFHFTFFSKEYENKKLDQVTFDNAAIFKFRFLMITILRNIFWSLSMVTPVEWQEHVWWILSIFSISF